MHGRGRLTDQDRERIEELATSGLKAGRIAQLIKKHPATVSGYMYKTGLKAPGPAPLVAKVYVRNGITVRQFCAEEDAFIEALRIQDFHLKKIAELVSKRFGAQRTEHSIRVRLIMLAAREEAA